MAKKRNVIGIFDSEADARRARQELIGAGIPETSIAMSANLAHDDIAAEAPGQSYENQPGQRPYPKTGGGWFGSLVGRNQVQQQRVARHADAAHAADCVVAVELSAGEDVQRVEEIMERLRARDVREC